MEAELLAEQLEDWDDTEAEEGKENRPPDAAGSFPWDSNCLMVQRMAEEAELRQRQRRGGSACRLMYDGRCMVVDVWQERLLVTKRTAGLRTQEVVSC